jgi:undecaprenyl-diphosphatase
LLDHPVTLVMLAFVLTAGPAFALKKVVSHNLENMRVIGAALLIGGAIMWAVDAMFTRPNTVDVDQVNWFQAAWIGLVQTLAAVFPGTSRSMCTIAAGQVAGLSRAAALDFSFFLSIPTMFVACGYDLLKTIHPGHDQAGLAPHSVTPQQWIVLAIGFIVSFFVAWGVVAWFMAWVRRRGFVPFAIYRIVLGLGVLIWLHGHGATA